MKKVLVTGAAGAIGINVIKSLLEDECEITALDLRTGKNIRKLSQFKKQINIIYGDVNDRFLMESLIKGHDYVIHLAGVLTPFANLKRDLCRIVDYEGTCNIVNSILAFNPNCFLIYASTTSLYEDKKNVTIESPIEIDENDYYSLYKNAAEEEIKKSLKNYTIFRLPIVLCNPNDDAPIYTANRSKFGEFISNVVAGEAFALAIGKKTKLNKKTFNLSGGENCRSSFKKYLVNVLKNYGLSVRYLITLMLVDKNYRIHYYNDSKEIEEILGYQSESLDEYYKRLQEYGKKRIIRRLLAKPFIFFLKR